jgi:hypothetical protein
VHHHIAQIFDSSNSSFQCHVFLNGKETFFFWKDIFNPQGFYENIMGLFDDEEFALGTLNWWLK